MELKKLKNKNQETDPRLLR